MPAHSFFVAEGLVRPAGEPTIAFAAKRAREGVAAVHKRELTDPGSTECVPPRAGLRAS
jgi:hypothetical protein